MAFELLTYPAVLDRVGSGRCHALLGNGFSIACDSIFSYPSLYKAAITGGLSTRAQSVFERLGTNNFEGVMRLLEDADWVAHICGLIEDAGSSLLDDVEIVKNTLVSAIATSHLEHTGMVADPKKSSALKFLQRFHNESPRDSRRLHSLRGWSDGTTKQVFA